MREIVKWFLGEYLQRSQSSEKMCWTVLWHVHCNACVSLYLLFPLCVDLSVSLSGIVTIERPWWVNLSDFANLSSNPKSKRLCGSIWRKKPFFLMNHWHWISIYVVGPPFWFRTKYLNSYFLDCIRILCRHGASSEWFPDVSPCRLKFVIRDWALTESSFWLGFKGLMFWPPKHAQSLILMRLWQLFN